ncbi:MAG TPA: SLBB domain-containing protein [Acidobacteriaceae bacterium]|nr:SLBB domain-containing protein [Acidobacteriaceae bacterium]
MRQLGFFVLTPLLVATATAQQQPSTPSGYPSGSQTSTNPDCSDPLLASSADCMGQDQGNGQQMNGIPQSGASVPGGFGAQTQNQNQNNNYTDTGQQNARQGQQNGANSQQQILLPPEPLTEFQKFIASTTSQVLPIFGANLFRRVPSTFAPLNMTPVPSDYVIGPGDELRVRVWGQVNFQANLQVDRAGEVYLPQVGPVHVAGMPFSELDGHLRKAIGRVYRNFDLTADIGQIRAIQVYVAGQARRPGVYTVSSLSTLVDTVFASGGPSIQGTMRHIELRRGSEVVTDFDLYALLVRGDKSKDVKLLPGDVIFIPAVGAEVAITGSVRTPAIYELREGESLDGLIADAGGVSAVAAEARVSIERISEHHDRFAMEVAYDANGLKTPLADGDLVHVYSIVPRYQKTVTLRGNIANPGRFAWHAGMRVSELIPDKDSLVTRNYWWKRAQLGLPAPEFEPIPFFSNMRQPTDGNPVTLRPRSQGGIGGSNGFGQQGQNGSQQSLDGNTNGVSGNGSNNAAGLRDNQNGFAQDQTGQNADGSQQGQFGLQQNQRLNAQQRGSNSSLAAQQSENFIGPAPAQRTEVRKLAPEIDWDYAVIQRQDAVTLKTTLISFDLGKLVLQHDSSQDMELQAGDVVSIFSEADIRVPIAEQTKLVTLSGEFVHSGVYSVQPGETFHHLVERAGGLTPNAFLYGSEYTRESTRAMQQARIDEYVQNLSMEIQRSNMAIAASGTGSAQDAAADASAQANEQSLLTNLRQIRATGRIVLNFVPTSSGAVNLPDISMEDGDHFSVPSVPATVNVVGAVYDQNSFLYATGRRVGEYLGLAGGPNRDADYKHSFLIRADGEVVSSDLGKGLWAEKFKNLRVYPGDTIVVPEKTYKPGTLRTVLAYSQLFSSLALGAAALSVIVP